CDVDCGAAAGGDCVWPAGAVDGQRDQWNGVPQRDAGHERVRSAADATAAGVPGLFRRRICRAALVATSRPATPGAAEPVGDGIVRVVGRGAGVVLALSAAVGTDAGGDDLGCRAALIRLADSHATGRAAS